MFIVDLLSAKYHLILTTSLSSYYPHFTENWDTERWNNLPQIMKLVSGRTKDMNAASILSSWEIHL